MMCSPTDRLFVILEKATAQIYQKNCQQSRACQRAHLRENSSGERIFPDFPTLRPRE